MAGMTDNPELVALIYTITGSAFLVGIFVGWAFTLKRVLKYRRKGWAIEPILRRDLIVKGGYTISFGLIVLVRFLPLEIRQALNLSSNVLWALLTSVPAAIGSLTYLYFEVFVIDPGPDPEPAEVRP